VLTNNADWRTSWTTYTAGIQSQTFSKNSTTAKHYFYPPHEVCGAYISCSLTDVFYLPVPPPAPPRPQLQPFVRDRCPSVCVCRCRPKRSLRCTSSLTVTAQSWYWWTGPSHWTSRQEINWLFGGRRQGQWTVKLKDAKWRIV